MKGFSRANLFRIQKIFKFYHPIAKTEQNDLIAHNVRQLYLYENHQDDSPTIGILLCKDKDDVVVDFALKNIISPLGVGKMQYTELAEEIKAVLPSLTELQDELISFDKGHYNEDENERI